MSNTLRKMIYSLWYFRKPPWDSGISPPELMDFINSHNPGKVLDLGCGTGTNAITLAKNGWQVTGVDFASPAISAARKKARAADVSVDFRVVDVTRLEGVNGMFDFFLDLGCFHSLMDKEKNLYIDQLIRLCSDQGHWLLYGFIKASVSTPGPGLVSGDLERILNQFTLVSRKDGVDRRERPSAYFLFCRKSS